MDFDSWWQQSGLVYRARDIAEAAWVAGIEEGLRRAQQRQTEQITPEGNLDANRD